jgi:hypothetical protein
MNINIALSQEEYQELKAEAVSKKKSLNAVVKEKIVPEKKKKPTKVKAGKLMKEIHQLAKEMAKYTKGFDSVKALREIRYGHE